MKIDFFFFKFHLVSSRYIGDARVRVSLARPRTRGGGKRRNFDPNMYDDQ
jgi:hypothetical protein